MSKQTSAAEIITYLTIRAKMSHSVYFNLCTKQSPEKTDMINLLDFVILSLKASFQLTITSLFIDLCITIKQKRHMVVSLWRATLWSVIFIISEISSASAASISSNLRELLLVNCDLEQESVDSELRMTLQWIAASELGLSVVYFRKSQEVNFSKVCSVQ